MALSCCLIEFSFFQLHLHGQGFASRQGEEQKQVEVRAMKASENAAERQYKVRCVFVCVCVCASLLLSCLVFC